MNGHINQLSSKHKLQSPKSTSTEKMQFSPLLIVLASTTTAIKDSIRCNSIPKYRVIQLATGHSSRLFPCEKTVLNAFCVRTISRRARTTTETASQFCSKMMAKPSTLRQLVAGFKNAGSPSVSYELY